MGILLFPSALVYFGTLFDTYQKSSKISNKGNALVYQIVRAQTNDQNVAYASREVVTQGAESPVLFFNPPSNKRHSRAEGVEFRNRTNTYLLGSC